MVAEEEDGFERGRGDSKPVDEKVEVGPPTVAEMGLTGEGERGTGSIVAHLEGFLICPVTSHKKVSVGTMVWWTTVGGSFPNI
jgi:hypothetical protein